MALWLALETLRQGGTRNKQGRTKYLNPLLVEMATCKVDLDQVCVTKPNEPKTTFPAPHKST